MGVAMTGKARISETMKRRLLLADDAPDNLELLTVLLGEKYELFSYSSCQEALSDLKKANPDLLLLDVRMYPIDGIEFLKDVRSIHRFRNVPAIAITALAHDEEKQRILAAGFQEIVIKPILDLAVIERIVDELLQTIPAHDNDALDQIIL
jgi:two-component system alkaline phosphatase synthesis response regulator PhoP